MPTARLQPSTPPAHRSRSYRVPAAASATRTPHRERAEPPHAQATSSLPPVRSPVRVGRPQLHDHAGRMSVAVEIDGSLLDDQASPLDRLDLSPVRADRCPDLDDVAEPFLVLH